MRLRARWRWCARRWPGTTLAAARALIKRLLGGGNCRPVAVPCAAITRPVWGACWWGGHSRTLWAAGTAALTPANAQVKQGRTPQGGDSA